MSVGFSFLRAVRWHVECQNEVATTPARRNSTGIELVFVGLAYEKRGIRTLKWGAEHENGRA